MPFYILDFFGGAAIGTMVAHLMFRLPLIRFSPTVPTRSGNAQLFSEIIFQLVCCRSSNFDSGHVLEWFRFAVGLYITAAYWFAASYSFAFCDDCAVSERHVCRHPANGVPEGIARDRRPPGRDFPFQVAVA